jgi:hypothetical protein
MKRLAKHITYVDRCQAPLGDKNTAQQLLVMLENSLLNSDVNYSIEQYAVPGHQRFGVLFKFDCCDFKVAFSGCVVAVKAIRKYSYDVLDLDVRSEKRSEKLLREMSFNQINSAGSQLHSVLLIMSNVYRLCKVTYVFKDGFTDALIQAYTQFNYNHIWQVPETIDYDDASGIKCIMLKHEAKATLIGYDFELTPYVKHCATPITICTFGSNGDFAEIKTTFIWYLKLSGLVAELSENEKNSVDNIIDFNTGFNLVGN